MRSLAVALLAAFVAAVACDTPPEAAESRLVDLAQPDLERLEPGVASRLREARAAVDSAGGSTALGEAYGALGQLYHAHELFDAASRCYANAATLRPAEHRWHYYLGQVSRSLEQVDTAQASFERALALKPRDVPTLLALARARSDLGDRERARELASAALEADSSSSGAHLLLAQLASAVLDHAAAARHYESILAAQPTATRLHQPLAMAYRSLGQADRAKELIDRRGDGAVVVADPLLTEIQRLRLGGRSDLAEGVAAFERGDVRAAARAFARAVEALPEDASARINLGSALMKLGDPKGALEQYRVAVELDPDDAQARFNIGTLHARAGDDASAVAAFEEALRLRPDYPAARFNLANARRRQGQCDAALEHYSRLVEQDPGSGGPRLGEIVCLVALGRSGDARGRAEAALAALPHDLALVEAAARILAAADAPGVRDGERALALARRLVAAQRGSSRHLETLAMAYAELGEWERAVAAQKQALALAEQRPPRLRARLSGDLDRYQRAQPRREPGLLDEDG